MAEETDRHLSADYRTIITLPLYIVGYIMSLPAILIVKEIPGEVFPLDFLRFLLYNIYMKILL